MSANGNDKGFSNSTYDNAFLFFKIWEFNENEDAIAEMSKRNMERDSPPAKTDKKASSKSEPKPLSKRSNWQSLRRITMFRQPTFQANTMTMYLSLTPATTYTRTSNTLSGKYPSTQMHHLSVLSTKPCRQIRLRKLQHRISHVSWIPRVQAKGVKAVFLRIQLVSESSVDFTAMRTFFNTRPMSSSRSCQSSKTKSHQRNAKR
jgi:hypothetical protein